MNRPLRPASRLLRLRWLDHVARALLLPLAFSLGLASCTHSGGWQLGLTPTALAAAQTDESGESAAGSYLAGRFALTVGDFPQAARALERASKADPDNLELRRQVFALLVAGGEFDRALSLARELVESDPGADEAALLLALDDARRGRYDAAVPRLERLGPGGLAGAARTILLAWAQHGSGETTQGIETLAAPDPGGGLERLHAYHRAVMLGLAGQPQAGLELLAATFSDLSAAPARVVRAAAELELRAGNAAGAKRLVARALESSAGDRRLEAMLRTLGQGGRDLGGIEEATDGMGDALVEIGEALAEQEGAAQALLFARLGSFVRPDDAGAALVVATVALRQGHADQALRALDDVPATSPLAWQANFLRAEALDELDRTEEAVRLLEGMTAQAPERADAPIALGDLLRGKERYAEAEAAYSQAIARLPELDRRSWRLLYARGIAYERTGRWPQAEADLLRALELEPDQPFVLNYLGYSWVDQHLNLERAKAMLHRAVELRTEDGFIVDSLGWAYYRLGEHEKAVTYLERAVELEPGDPVINDHLGDAYWRVGRTREARFQWQRALIFEPEADLVPTIQDKLARGLPDAAPRRG